MDLFSLKGRKTVPLEAAAGAAMVQALTWQR